MHNGRRINLKGESMRKHTADLTNLTHRVKTNLVNTLETQAFRLTGIGVQLQRNTHTLSNGLTPPKLRVEKGIKLTPAEQALDLSARLVVSNELGHARIEVTRTYLG